MIEIPLRIYSVANLREHWAKRAKRAARERDIARLASRKCGKCALPCTVKLTRIAPRELDTDNLASGFKACRDGVADWLGVKDNDPRVQWAYAQEKRKPKEYAIQIEIVQQKEGQP